jgi:hypothetical protein
LKKDATARAVDARRNIASDTLKALNAPIIATARVA